MILGPPEKDHFESPLTKLKIALFLLRPLAEIENVGFCLHMSVPIQVNSASQVADIIKEINVLSPAGI